MSRGVLVAVLVAMLATLAVVVDCYKVLVVFPFTGKSHAILGDGYVRELLKRGHEVTYVTPFPRENLPANLTEIDISFSFDLFPTDFLNVSQLLGDYDPTEDMIFFEDLMTTMSEQSLKHENFQSLMRDNTQHFDLIVLEWFYAELYIGLAALYRYPLVWTSSVDMHTMLMRLIDGAPNPLLVPDLMHPQSPPFNFEKRIQALWSLIGNLRITTSFDSRRQASYKEIFGPLAAKRGVILPPYMDVLYNGSFVLTNTHPSLGGATIVPQNVKAVGGYHIDTSTKPLPSNLQKIMDEAKHGVIYFSLGTNVKSKDMPHEMKTALLKMFGGLKQTVLWKFEDDFPNLPKNVHIQSWMPQPSILAHPNLKIFITHGGLLSTTETVHYGVPIIGVPLFADQFMNMKRAVEKGYAYYVKFSFDLAGDLKNAIEEILTNTSYSETVKKMTSLYHDRLTPPAEELVYWLEYVVRTGGAPHLRSSALLLPWYQKFYLDLLALIAALSVASALLVTYLVRKVCRTFCRGKPQDKKKIN